MRRGDVAAPLPRELDLYGKVAQRVPGTRTVNSSGLVKAMRVAKEGGDVLPSSPDEYASMIVREDALWGPLVRGLNIKVE